MDAFEPLSEQQLRFLELFARIAAATAQSCDEDADRVRRKSSEVCEDWIQRLSGHTLVAYGYDLRKWCKWIEGRQLATSPLASDQLKVFLTSVHLDGSAGSSLHRLAATIRVWLTGFDLLTPERLESLRPFRLAQSVLPTRKTGHPKLPSTILDRLESAINWERPRDVRDLAFATLLAETALRPGDILGIRSLKMWHLQPVQVEDYSRCRDGTGRLMLRPRDERTASPQEPAFLSQRAVKNLDAWLAISGLRAGPLFRAFRAEAVVYEQSPPLPSDQANRALRRLGKLAGLEVRLSPRTMQAHTANEMLRAGLHLDEVRRAIRRSQPISVYRLHAGEQVQGSIGDVFRRFGHRRKKHAHRDSVDLARQLCLPGM